jgi:hypothetical protein
MLLYPTLNAVRPSVGGYLVLGLFFVVIQGALALLTVELTWGTADFWKRLSVYTIWILAGVNFWLIAAISSQGNDSWHEILPNLAVIPLLSLCSQIPLWGLRYVGRFQLSLRETAAPRDKWSLRNFGVGTILVAAVLAATRVIDMPDSVWMLMAGSAVAMSVTFGLPAALYVLLPEKIEFAFVGAAIHYVVLLVAFVVTAGITGELRRIDEAGILLWHLACYVAGPVVGFLILRRGGRRVVRAI